MITEQDLISAIAECQGERNPNANTCIKLAAYYIIYNQLFDKAEKHNVRLPEMQMVSSLPGKPINTPKIDYKSDTEFSRAVQGRTFNDIMPILDELMSTLAVLYPRMYDGVMRKFEE